jgi:DNA modification methylase
MIRILIGDMAVRLGELPNASVDSCVCDPPYHLTSIVKRFGAENAAPAKVGATGAFARASKGFMGQTWDGGDVAFRPETWAEVLRVLKPGGHLVAFSGTRTYHRMAVAIEDAGFEIRDQLAWIYGSGFPKSHNVGQSIEKLKTTGKSRRPDRDLGGLSRHRFSGSEEGSLISDTGGQVELTTEAAREWEGWGTALKPAWEPICLARKPISEKNIAANVLKWGTGAINVDATRIKNAPTSPDADRNSPADSRGDTSRERVVCLRCCTEDRLVPGVSAPAPADRNGPPASASADARDGRQSLGSPDDCPTCRDCGGELVRAVQVDGQASLLQSPDADSVRAPDGAGGHSREGLSKPSKNDTAQDVEKQYIPNGKNKVYGSNMGGGDWSEDQLGRWPANLVHDGSDEVVAGFPETASGSLTAAQQINGGFKGAKNCYGTADRGGEGEYEANSGSAARFFYCAKATTDERGEGNNHPTVKPVDLMRWLVRLVTPKGGTVLDPFMGSGSTLIAADAEQFNAIGCELSPEYAAIAERRIRDAAGMFANVQIDGLEAAA